MRLRELDAELVGTVADGVLYFLCPHPACQAAPNGIHSLRVPISSAPFHEREPRDASDGPRGKNGKVKVWQATGEFPETLTLAPSIHIAETDAAGKVIRTICWHGHVRDGAAA